MHIWRTAGLRGFYEGWGATLLTYVPASLVWWPTYEYCKVPCVTRAGAGLFISWLSVPSVVGSVLSIHCRDAAGEERRQQSGRRSAQSRSSTSASANCLGRRLTVNSVVQMASGVLAGFCTVIVSNPFDVVKTVLFPQSLTFFSGLTSSILSSLRSGSKHNASSWPAKG